MVHIVLGYVVAAQAAATFKYTIRKMIHTVG